MTVAVSGAETFCVLLRKGSKLLANKEPGKIGPHVRNIYAGGLGQLKTSTDQTRN
jgi:hypothetical protein